MLIAVKDLQFFDRARGEHVQIAANESCDEIPEPNLGIYLAQGLVRDTSAPSSDDQEEATPIDPPAAADAVDAADSGSAAGAPSGSPKATKKTAKKRATKKKTTKKKTRRN